MTQSLPPFLANSCFSRAPNVGRNYKDESEGAASLTDVDSPHVTAVDPNFLNQSVKTTTQAGRLEREAKEEEEKRQTDEQASPKAKARAKAKTASLRANSDNPVVIGNAVLITLLGAGLGFGAYRQHVQGKLSWETIGLWSGAVGAFTVVDYFASK